MIKAGIIKRWQSIKFWRSMYLGALIVFSVIYYKDGVEREKAAARYEDLKQSFFIGSFEIRDSLISVFHVKKDVADRLAPSIKQNADRFKLNWRQLTAKIKAESNFDPLAISNVETRIGKDAFAEAAYGLMQIKPETARMLALELHLDYVEGCLFNENTNILLGAYYFYKLQGALEFSFENATKAYNCGLSGFYAGLFSEQHWRKVLYNYKLLNGEKDTVLAQTINTEEKRRRDAKSGK